MHSSRGSRRPRIGLTRPRSPSRHARSASRSLRLPCTASPRRQFCHHTFRRSQRGPLAPEAQDPALEPDQVRTLRYALPQPCNRRPQQLRRPAWTLARDLSPWRLRDRAALLTYALSPWRVRGQGAQPPTPPLRWAGAASFAAARCAAAGRSALSPTSSQLTVIISCLVAAEYESADGVVRP